MGRGRGKEPGNERWAEEGGGGGDWKRRPEAEGQNGGNPAFSGWKQGCGQSAPALSGGLYLLVWKRWSGSVRWQDESWQPKSLMSRQPGSSLGQVPTPRGGPRSGKGSSGVRNFSYEVVADASSDMVGDGLARAPSPAPSCSRDRPCPHSNLSAVAAAGVCPPQLPGRLRTAAHRCPGTAGRHEGAARSYRRLPATQSAPQWPLQAPQPSLPLPLLLLPGPTQSVQRRRRHPARPLRSPLATAAVCPTPAGRGKAAGSRSLCPLLARRRN